MTWPAERITKPALWKLAESDTDTLDTRARGVRRKDTRKLVRDTPRVPRQSRREAKYP